jgi:hypothetical protein
MELDFSTHLVAEKLFEEEGTIASHTKLGRPCWQKLSKKDVSHPVAVHFPQLPQDLHDANPGQESLEIVTSSFLAKIKDCLSETDDAVHSMADGTEG